MTRKHCASLFQVKYSIYRPSGNDTAFVYGLNYTKEQKKKINDAIMAKHANVEQVGFVEIGKRPELQMAGGEFCGNATRSAASIYLNGKEGNLQMLVNSKDVINTGIDENGKAWCEIPLYHGNDVIREIEHGVFIVKMNGMISVVVQKEVAKKFLVNKENLKSEGMNLIHKYKLENSEAVGIMFCEIEQELLKINPIVWVKAIDTLFYETACGSGTTAVCMVEAFLKKQNQKIDILQPSGLVITASVINEEGHISKATISGNVETDGKTYSMEISLEEDNKMKRNIKAITRDEIEDFIELYRVFRDSPYFENWTDEMIYEEYRDLESSGHIYGYYLDNKCVGLITFRPMRLVDHHPVYYEHPEKVAYLADMTVLKEYRGNGIGTSLMKYAINMLKKEGFEKVYMKTLEIGKSMSYSIAIKLGFKLLDEITSVDTMKRTDERVDKNDIKIYLERKL